MIDNNKKVDFCKHIYKCICIRYNYLICRKYLETLRIIMCIIEKLGVHFMQIFVRDKEFYSQVKRLAIPVVLQGMITAGVGMMDTLMVGKLGEIQLSAASLANQFIMIFMIMCFGLGFGAAVLTAQFYGGKNILALRKIVTIMLRIALILALGFTVVTYLKPDTIMSLYTPDREIIQKGALYFRISAFSFLFMGISLTLTAILRSVGQVRLPLVTSIIAFIVNVGLNYIFIFGKLGAPRMEIQGAALGTLVTRILEASIIVFYFMTKEKKINYRVNDLFLSTKEYTMLYITISLPVLVSDTFLALGNNMLAVIMGHIGANFVAAYAIIATISRMTTVFVQGVSNASSIMTGNTLGAGDKEKTYRQGITFAGMAVVIGLVAGGVLLIITPLVINIFEISEETNIIARQLMYAMSFIMIFQAVQGILTKGVLRGGGDTKFLMVADVLFLWIVSLPLGYMAGLVWQLPAYLIFIALKADWIIKAFWCLKRLSSGKWIKRVEMEEIKLKEALE